MQKVFVQRIIRTTHSEFQGGDLNADSGHFYQEGEKKKRRRNHDNTVGAGQIQNFRPICKNGNHWLLTQLGIGYVFLHALAGTNSQSKWPKIVPKCDNRDKTTIESSYSDSGTNVQVVNGPNMNVFWKRGASRGSYRKAKGCLSWDLNPELLNSETDVLTTTP